MDVVFAVLADSANVSQEGKLNILGNFANISATVFPARHPEMQLVLRMEAPPAEIGTQKKFEMIMLDEDGQKIGGFSADFEVPQAQSPGETVNMQSIIRLVDVVFPKPGRYVINVLINGDTKAQVPLRVGGQ
jgi:hypothetical protein